MDQSNNTSAALRIRVVQNGGLPLYQQLANQLKYLMASGRLRPGEELPPIRVLAERLVINPSTVARAYRELEIERLVEKRSTNGTFVAEAESPFAEGEQRRILTDRVDALLVEAKQFRVATGDVIALIEERDRVLSEGEPVK
jgi:DNA-binding transcriptional regulator YhcF (GntR family)